MKAPTIEGIMVAARTVWGEARGETYLGKVAVAHVILNRWRRDDGQWGQDVTLTNTCQRKWQFSAWLTTDPNYKKMLSVGAEDRAFRESLRAVLEALDASTDPTFGATHYKTDAAKPAWAEGHEPVVRIGRHAFYQNIK